MGTIAFDWGKGYYADSIGEGDPLLFLHGTGCDSDDWAGVLAGLLARRTVCMDFRGHGKSDVPRGTFTLSDLASDVLRLVDSLGLDRVVLVGHSLGGMVALDAASRSGRIAGLVLLEGWTRLAACDAFGHERFYGRLSPDKIDAIRRKDALTRKRFAPSAWRHFWDSVEAFDASAYLATAHIPIVDAYGSLGRPASPKEALLIPDNPNIRLAWVEGAGHYLPHENPGEVARLCLL